MTTPLDGLVVGGRFDLFKVDEFGAKSWHYRIIAHWDDSYVYLQPTAQSPVDTKVDRKTGKSYQWLYGGWETSEYQNTDRNPGAVTVRFGFKEEDFEDLGDTLNFKSEPQVRKVRTIHCKDPNSKMFGIVANIFTDTPIPDGWVELK